jgi:cytochrome P450
MSSGATLDASWIRGEMAHESGSRDSGPIGVRRLAGVAEITDHAGVKAAAKAWGTFSSDLLGDRDVRTYRQLPLEVDPPAHTEYQAILTPVFGRQEVGALEPQFRADARDLVALLADRRRALASREPSRGAGRAGRRPGSNPAGGRRAPPLPEPAVPDGACRDRRRGWSVGARVARRHRAPGLRRGQPRRRGLRGTRGRASRPEPNPHVAFGNGPHTCIAVHLARIEARVFLEELLAAVPDWRVGAGAQIEVERFGGSEVPVRFHELPIEVGA